MNRPAGPPLPWVCLITDHRACEGGYSGLERTVVAALRGGVNVVQLREKSLPAGELYELAWRLRCVTHDAEAALIVNDRLDIALAIGADGVHLGEAGLPVSVGRNLAAGRLVGRSVHGLAAAVEAERDGADYLAVGTIFPSATHPDLPVSGPHLIRKVRTHVKLPLLAIGGLTADNAAQVIADGASGVAVIRSILADPYPELAARRLVERVQAAWPSAVLHRGVDRG